MLCKCLLGCFAKGIMPRKEVQLVWKLFYSSQTQYSKSAVGWLDKRRLQRYRGRLRKYKAALNFSPALHATTNPSGLRNPLLSNLNEDSKQVLCGSDLLWYQLVWRHAHIVMKNFAHSRRMYKTPKCSWDLSAKTVCLQIFSNYTLSLPVQFKHFGKLSRVPFSVSKDAILSSCITLLSLLTTEGKRRDTIIFDWNLEAWHTPVTKREGKIDNK